MKLLTTPEERARYIKVGDPYSGVVDAAKDVNKLIALLAHTYSCVAPDAACLRCAAARRIILEFEGA